MKRKTILFFFIVFLFYPFLVFPYFYFRSQYNLFYNSISGEGRYQSYLSEGFKYITQIQLFTEDKLGDFNYDINLSGTSTDDKKINYENYSVDNLRIKLSHLNNFFQLGDIFSYISQYTLNMPVKGLQIKYSNDFLEINGIYGLAVPSWNSIYGKKETRMMRRYATGAKLRINLTDFMWVASNLSFLNDDVNTRVNDFDPVYDNKIYSGEVEINPFEGVSFYSEYAYSKTKHIPYINQPEQFLEDYGLKFRLILDGDPIWSTHEYEKIMADFITVAGSAIPDREKANTRWKIKITEDIWLKTGFLWFRDNLENKKEVRTDVINPDAGITFKNWFGDKNFVLNVNYRYNKRYNKLSSLISNSIGADYSDQFFVIDTNLGANYSDEILNNITKRYNINWNASASLRQDFNLFAIKPEVKANGSFALNKENDKNSKWQEVRGDLTIEIVSINLNLSGGYGKSYNITENNDVFNKTVYESSIYFMPFSSFILSLKYSKNIYDFSETAEISGRDYTEDTFNLNAEISF